MASGKTITRSVGFAILGVENHFTVDEVVFAEKGDLRLLGSRTLEGLNLTVDPQRKKLVVFRSRPRCVITFGNKADRFLDFA